MSMAAWLFNITHSFNANTLQNCAQPQMIQFGDILARNIDLQQMPRSQLEKDIDLHKVSRLKTEDYLLLILERTIPNLQQSYVIHNSTKVPSKDAQQ